DSLINSGNLVFNHTDATTFTTPVSGNGYISKIGGAGDTTPTDVSSYTGSFTAQAGLMILQSGTKRDSYAAYGNGTLRFAGSFINLGLRSIVAGAGGEIEYQDAYVYGAGGFLRGPGTHTILPGASYTVLSDVSTYSSTNIVQNGTTELFDFT